jgi:hypothetical protein
MNKKLKAEISAHFTISFEDDGDLDVVDQAHEEAQSALRIDPHTCEIEVVRVYEDKGDDQ